MNIGVTHDQDGRVVKRPSVCESDGASGFGAGRSSSAGSLFPWGGCRRLGERGRLPGLRAPGTRSESFSRGES